MYSNNNINNLKGHDGMMTVIMEPLEVIIHQPIDFVV
jgi:hypothetical protein